MSFVPLSGLVVVDFSGTLPGPLCTQTLRQLGADVIKIEAPSGDVSRGYGFFEYLNRGKAGEVLDLKSDEGLTRARDLVASADVVIEGFRPGVMARFGLSYEDLAEDFPTLVYCAISGAGQHGPGRTDPGHDLNYLAATGVLNRHRDHDGSLVKTPLPAPVADITAALLATIGILSALMERRMSGRGRLVDVSLLDASLLLGATDLLDALKDDAGDVELPPGTEVPHYGLFETKDGRAISLGIMPFEQAFWAEFCDKAGIGPEWRDMSVRDRMSRSEEVRAHLASVVAQSDYEMWCERLGGSNVAWAPVRNAREVLEAFGGSGVPGLPDAQIPIGVCARSSAGAEPA